VPLWIGFLVERWLSFLLLRIHRVVCAPDHSQLYYGMLNICHPTRERLTPQLKSFTCPWTQHKSGNRLLLIQRHIRLLGSDCDLPGESGSRQELFDANHQSQTEPGFEKVVAHHACSRIGSHHSGLTGVSG
jgi:hypothetical protein